MESRKQEWGRGHRDPRHLGHASVRAHPQNHRTQVSGTHTPTRTQSPGIQDARECTHRTQGISYMLCTEPRNPGRAHAHNPGIRGAHMHITEPSRIHSHMKQQSSPIPPPVGVWGTVGEAGSPGSLPALGREWGPGRWFEGSQSPCSLSSQGVSVSSQGLSQALATTQTPVHTHPPQINCGVGIEDRCPGSHSPPALAPLPSQGRD